MEKYRSGNDPREFAYEQKPEKVIRGYDILIFELIDFGMGEHLLFTAGVPQFREANGYVQGVNPMNTFMKEAPLIYCFKSYRTCVDQIT